MVSTQNRQNLIFTTTQKKKKKKKKKMDEVLEAHRARVNSKTTSPTLSTFSAWKSSENNFVGLLLYRVEFDSLSSNQIFQ